MADRVQRRGGTQAANDAFTGAEREITVDTTNWNLRLHDGATQGGHPLVPGTRSLTGGDGIQAIGDLSQDRTVAVDATVLRDSQVVTTSSGAADAGKLVDLNASGEWDTSVIPTLDLSFISDSGAAAAKGVTGSDANAVTGTAGTSGNIPQWNADGDLVDGGAVASEVAAGAIVESGTNSNGSYIRYENGEQVCRKKGLSVPFDSAARCLATWTYPAAFISSDVSVTAILDGASVAANATPGRDSMAATSKGTTGSAQVDITQYRIAGGTDFQSGDSVSVDIVAWGFWK